MEQNPSHGLMKDHFGYQPLDIIGGLDIASVMSSREKGEAISQDQAHFKVETSRDRKNIQTDLRPRIQLSTDFNKIGLYLGYSYGLKNCTPAMMGLSQNTYSRMLRFGLSYRLQ